MEVSIRQRACLICCCGVNLAQQTRAATRSTFHGNSSTSPLRTVVYKPLCSPERGLVEQILDGNCLNIKWSTLTLSTSNQQREKMARVGPSSAIIILCSRFLFDKSSTTASSILSTVKENATENSSSLSFQLNTR